MTTRRLSRSHPSVRLRRGTPSANCGRCDHWFLLHSATKHGSCRIISGVLPATAVCSHFTDPPESAPLINHPSEEAEPQEGLSNTTNKEPQS